VLGGIERNDVGSGQRRRELRIDLAEIGVVVKLPSLEFTKSRPSLGRFSWYVFQLLPQRKLSAM